MAHGLRARLFARALSGPTGSSSQRETGFKADRLGVLGQALAAASVAPHASVGYSADDVAMLRAERVI